MIFTKISFSPYLVSALCVGIFWSLFWNGLNTAWLYTKQNFPRLSVVDMQVLLAQKSQHLARATSKTALNTLLDQPPFRLNKISKTQLQKAKDQMKETLETFATKHHLILLAKGAVMGGNLPDYTFEIGNILEDQFLEGEDIHD